jgi:hypothetical protein
MDILVSVSRGPAEDGRQLALTQRRCDVGLHRRDDLCNAGLPPVHAGRVDLLLGHACDATPGLQANLGHGVGKFLAVDLPDQLVADRLGKLRGDPVGKQGQEPVAVRRRVIEPAFRRKIDLRNTPPESAFFPAPESPGPSRAPKTG